MENSYNQKLSDEEIEKSLEIPESFYNEGDKEREKLKRFLAIAFGVLIVLILAATQGYAFHAFFLLIILLLVFQGTGSNLHKMERGADKEIKKFYRRQKKEGAISSVIVMGIFILLLALFYLTGFFPAIAFATPLFLLQKYLRNRKLRLLVIRENVKSIGDFRAAFRDM